MIVDKQEFQHTYWWEQDEEDVQVTVEVIAEYPTELAVKGRHLPYDVVETYLKTPAPGIDREELHRIIVDKLNDCLF